MPEKEHGTIMFLLYSYFGESKEFNKLIRLIGMKIGILP